MGLVNLKFIRLRNQDQDEDILLKELGETQSRGEGRRSNPWRAVTLVLSVFCLLTIISLIVLAAEMSCPTQLPETNTSSSVDDPSALKLPITALKEELQETKDKLIKTKTDKKMENRELKEMIDTLESEKLVLEEEVTQLTANNTLLLGKITTLKYYNDLASRRLTDQISSTPRSVNKKAQQDEDDLSPTNCHYPKPFDPSEITCQASTELDTESGCKQAFLVGKKKSSWASKGEGVGAWIKATFPSKKYITKLKLLQRNFPGEANEMVEICVRRPPPGSSCLQEHLATPEKKGDKGK